MFLTASRTRNAAPAATGRRRNFDRHRRRIGPIALLAISTLLALPPAVGAATLQTEFRPDDFSAADQYKESVPTSKGPSPSAAERAHRSPLPPGVAARLRTEGGPATAALEQAATSSRFGAPQGKLKSANGGADTPSVPSAAVSAVDGSGGGGLPWLLIALLTLTGLVAGTAAHKRHQNRKSTDRA